MPGFQVSLSPSEMTSNLESLLKTNETFKHPSQVAGLLELQTPLVNVVLVQMPRPTQPITLQALQQALANSPSLDQSNAPDLAQVVI